MQIRNLLLNATACLHSSSKLSVYVDEDDLERLELFATASMNTGVICDVTLLRLVNIYDVSKDLAALIYEVKQSKGEVLDSLTVKVKELRFFLKPVNIYLSVRRNISKRQIFAERFWGLWLVTNYKPLHIDW